MTVFVDATCEYSEFYRLPLVRPPRVGEILEFTGMGAYTACLASRFHARTAPGVEIG